ncbi:MAG TPA: hypothetical protein VFR09_07615, partial [Alphaproteobacteria bacterium]|nr:hypothetical protein [Alphaproteobacteria bacterium]
MSKLLEKHPDLLPKLKQNIVGFAQDFWKDGHENPFQHGKPLPMTAGTATPKQAPGAAPAPAAPAAPKPIWQAPAGAILEKMWGDGFITPADAELLEPLLGAVGLTKDMSVLDLSAGLGGRMRLIAGKYGASVTGLDPDPEIAARGMELAIE